MDRAIRKPIKDEAWYAFAKIERFSVVLNNASKRQLPPRMVG